MLREPAILSVARERARLALIIALAAGSTCYFLLLARNHTYVVGGSDSSGYMNFARLIASGRLTREITPVAEIGLEPRWGRVFVPLGFTPVEGHSRIAPTYPVGLPLHFAVAGLVGGWPRAPFLVVPLTAAGCLLLTYVLGRDLGLSRFGAVAAAAALGGLPAFVFVALQAFSDVPATFWNLLAIACALRPSRRQAVAAGTAFAIGVLVRPTNLLLLPALLVAMRFRWNRVLLMGASAAPFAFAMLWIQRELYGHPLRTGYGTVSEQLSAQFFSAAFSSQSQWLVQQATPLVFPVALLVGFVRPRDWWRAALVATWFLPMFAFYSFYGVHGSLVDTRFLLPALPPLFIAAVLIVESAARTLIRERMAATAIATILAAGLAVYTGKQTRRHHTLAIRETETIYPAALARAEAELTPDAMVLAGLWSGTFLYSGRFAINWWLLDTNDFRSLRAKTGSRRWYALLSDVELPPAAFRERYPGNWTACARIRDATLWRLDE